MRRIVRFWLVIICAVPVLATIQGCATARRAERAGDIPSGWPVPRSAAVVTSGFGAPRDGTRHQGIDLAAPAGTPVTATAAGTVTTAERIAGYGRTVVLEHGGGWQTRYAHLKRIKVDRGQRVGRGDVVGTVGHSGNASGAHLHYEIQHHGSPVDPRPYLDGR